MAYFKGIHVGCGAISQQWMNAPSYKEGVEIVGLVDLDEDVAVARRDACGLSNTTPIFQCVEQAIAETSPDIVFDTTVPSAHHRVTTTALKAGCHVLGEKPMASTMDEARDMVSIAERYDRVYAVTQTRRWSENMLHLQDIIQRGDLGRVHALQAEFTIAAHFGGFRAEMDQVLLLDMAIHTFDNCRQFIPHADPLWVQAHVWTPPNSRYAHGPCAHALFAFDDGTVFDYRGNWTANGQQTSWDADWHIQGTAGAVRVGQTLGSRMELLVPPLTPPAREGGPLIVPLAERAVPAKPASVNQHDAAIADFLHAIRHGTEPTNRAAENIKSLAMVHAAIKAAETGHRQPVEW